MNTVQKKNYWYTETSTVQFQQIISTLEDCKTRGRTGMIIGATGCGKTFAVESFCRKHPEFTFRITISSVYKLEDIIIELSKLTNATKVVLDENYRKGVYTRKMRIESIVHRLVTIKETGGKPIIIFDEGENMITGVLKMMKDLYDALEKYCSIVIMGTGQLLTKIHKAVAADNEGIPQMYRRFKAGQRSVAPIKKKEEFAKFFIKLQVNDNGLRMLLLKLCENYGELNSFLEPVLREADETKISLSEHFFRTFYDMPQFAN